LARQAAWILKGVAVAAAELQQDHFLRAALKKAPASEL
jgi:hypothetical protein